MKLKALLLFVLAALLPLSASRSARAADVSFDFFYEALLPHGEWIEVADYGFCWRPTEVDRDWTPYSDGYWTFTDAGWTWVGYEEFAGIVYHYGRWMNLESEGWCWVPDYEWGPAWVSWRKSDDYVGWAPLPPRAYWRPEIGISTWVDTAYDIGPAFYSFCRVRDFGAPVLRPVIINRSRNLVIIRGTVNITNITYNMHGTVPVIFNGGPSYTVISQRCERPIPALKLVIRTQFDRADFRGGAGRFSANARTVGNQLLVNAPLVAGPAQREFLREKAKKKVAADKVLSGWAGVQDGKERAELRQRFQRETKGITPYTAPARAVLAADLKAVPLEGDASAVPPGFGGKGTRGKAGSASDMPPPAQPAVAGPGEPPLTEPRGVVRAEEEKGRRKKDGETPPAVISGAPSKPPRPPVTDNPAAPATPPVATVPEPARPADPQTLGKSKPAKERPEQEPTPKPVVIVPPVAPAIGGVPADPAQKPQADAPAGVIHPPGERKPAAAVVDPAVAQAQAEAERQKLEAEKQRAAQADAEKIRNEQKRMGPQRDVEARAAAAREKQAAEQAAAAARERADLEKESKDLEKRRAAQAAAEKLRAEQELAKRKLNAEAEAAAQRQKQEAEAAALAAGKQKEEAKELQQAAQKERARQEAERLRLAREQEAAAAAALEKQREDQRQAEAGKQAEMKRQQAEAQAKEHLKQQQEQIAEQRRLMQVEQQKAAQEAAKQQAAARAREQQAEQQAEQQRAAQEAVKQQAAEQRRQLQIEQQRAAQEAAKQQAAEQRRALEAERQQAARQQQIEQQRAAQDAARKQAAEQAREQQMEQQRAAREAARQQAAAEQRRQQQIEQQKAAQENARQQAGQQHRAMEAQREQAARQQAEAQRAAQQQAAQAAQQQAAQEQRRGERGRERDKDKDR